MPDTTFFQLFVYNVPADQRDAALEVINEHELDEDWDENTARRGRLSELKLGEAYTDYLALLNATEEIGCALRDAAPGSTFECWTDPKYEVLGEVMMYTPELGEFRQECDSNGTPLLGQDELRRVVLAQPVDATREGILEAIDRAAGAPWMDRIGELRRQLQAESQEPQEVES